MNTYIITRSYDGSEWGVTSVENHVKCPLLSRDAEGNPMLLMEVFFASSWKRAGARLEELRSEFDEEKRSY